MLLYKKVMRRNKMKNRYNDFAREEIGMIRKCYGNNSVEENRRRAHRILKQKREAREKIIKEIMEKANVPRWKAELYYNYSSDTRKFLYFRDGRLKSNFKNEIKRCFNEDFEDECITTIDWKELYEILGSVPYFKDILAAITKILGHIASLAKKNAILPYIFEEEMIWSIEHNIPDFSVLEDLEEEIPIIEEAIKRYLLTELPEGSVISLDFFEKLYSRFVRRIEYRVTPEGADSEDVYAYTKRLCVKTEFSYSNKK